MTLHKTVVLALIIGLGCGQKIRFVVPNGFEGVAVVVFDDPAGDSAVGDLKIPDSGVLFLEREFRGGFFDVSIEGAGGEDDQELDCGQGTREACFSLLKLSGNLNGCLPEGTPQFDLVTFVVAKSALQMEWYERQEQVVREATLASLDHRGLSDVASCYRERPHELSSYQQVPDNVGGQERAPE